ncbi:MAG: hypothetical protein GC150_05020 [Rhizobiales bacterium]|nr:hypothetical protein [Hyphomicrobiales bacterium]
MRIAFFVSLFLHAALIGWGLLEFGQSKPLDLPQPTRINVEIVDIAELTRIRQGTPKPEPTVATPPPPKETPPAKTPTPPKRVAALPPPAPAAPSEPVPPAAKSEPEATAAPAAAPAPPRKPKPPARAERPKPATQQPPKKTPPARREQRNNFDSEDIAALLNKLPDAAPAAAAQPAQTEALGNRQRRTPNVLGQADGQGDQLTISEFDFFMRQIGQCWTPPVGAANAQALLPVIAFELDRNGAVTGIPRVVNHQSSPFFIAAADAAIRAIKACQPYRLPKDKYDDWARNEITFDPTRMFGG